MSLPNTPAAFPSQRPGHSFQPIPEKAPDGHIIGHAVQTILVQPGPLFDLWSNVQSIPRWQEHVVSVTPVSERVSHWVMGDPDDPSAKRIEFDSEVTESVPGERIVWRSISGDVDLHGEVLFTPAANGRGTVVKLVQSMKVPGGTLGNAIASAAKRSPRQTIIEDLRHFKQMAEAGEIPTVTPQPHGPRGVSGGMKEWMYGETNPTPLGTSDLA